MTRLLSDLSFAVAGVMAFLFTRVILLVRAASSSGRQR